MNTLILITAFFCAVSFCLAVFCLIHVAKYENLRVRGKDNEDALDSLDRKYESLRQKVYRELRKESRGNKVDDFLYDILRNNMGMNAEQHDVEHEQDYED